jgi:TetR/AcrR family transcriptional regulator
VSIGFSAMRLDDIAELVGVKRAAIFYYFKNSREIRAATLERLAAVLAARLQLQLSQPTSLVERLEATMVALVDFLSERPAFSHLVLLLASEGPFASHADARTLAEPFLRILEGLLAEGEQTGLLRPVTRDPLQFASIVVGSTIFRMAAMPIFSPPESSATNSDHLELHRSEVLAVLRILLGVRSTEIRAGSGQKGRPRRL